MGLIPTDTTQNMGLIPTDTTQNMEENINKDKNLTNNNEIINNELIHKIAIQTGGYVASDLINLIQTIKNIIINEKINNNIIYNINTNKIEINIDTVLLYFYKAMKIIKPSCLRGVSINLPTLNYTDIIGYNNIKKSLQRILLFIKPEYQVISNRFNLQANPGGVLLYGPPGNSKTRLITATAAHYHLPMLTLSAADIFSPYVGDAEAEIRRCFQLARQTAPCILFIDELDSIVTNRSNSTGGGGSSSASVEGRVLATLLTEMDGIQNTHISSSDSSSGSSSSTGSSDATAGVRNSSGGVIVLGATNRLDFIDAALIRKVS